MCTGPKNEELEQQSSNCLKSHKVKFEIVCILLSCMYKNKTIIWF